MRDENGNRRQGWIHGPTARRESPEWYAFIITGGRNAHRASEAGGGSTLLNSVKKFFTQRGTTGRSMSGKLGRRGILRPQSDERIEDGGNTKRTTRGGPPMGGMKKREGGRGGI